MGVRRFKDPQWIFNGKHKNNKKTQESKKRVTACVNMGVRRLRGPQKIFNVKHKKNKKKQEKNKSKKKVMLVVKKAHTPVTVCVGGRMSMKSNKKVAEVGEEAPTSKKDTFNKERRPPEQKSNSVMKSVSDYFPQPQSARVWGEGMLGRLSGRPEVVEMGNKYLRTRAAKGAFLEEYLKFLVVKALEGDFSHSRIAPPSLGVDKLWHDHMLQTAAYASTCDRLFGQYVYRKPGITGIPNTTYWSIRSKYFHTREVDSVTMPLVSQDYTTESSSDMTSQDDLDNPVPAAETFSELHV